MTPEIEKQIVSLIEAAKQTGNDAAAFIAQLPKTKRAARSTPNTTGMRG